MNFPTKLKELRLTRNLSEEALICYREKYGLSTTLDNYIIYFEPLGILSLKEIA